MFPGEVLRNLVSLITLLEFVIAVVSKALAVLQAMLMTLRSDAH